MPTLSDRATSSASQVRDLGGGVNWSYGRGRLYRTLIPLAFCTRSGFATKTVITPADLPIDLANAEEAQKLAMGTARLISQTHKQMRHHRDYNVSAYWGSWLLRTNAFQGQANPMNNFRVGVLDSYQYSTYSYGQYGSQSRTAALSYTLRILLGSNKTTNQIFYTNIAQVSEMDNGDIGQFMWYQTTTTATETIPSWPSATHPNPINVTTYSPNYTPSNDKLYWMMVPINLGLNF